MDSEIHLSGFLIIGLHLSFFGLFFYRGRVPYKRNITIFTIALLCGFSPVSGFPILLLLFTPIIGKTIAVPLYRSVVKPRPATARYQLIVVPTAGVYKSAEDGWRASPESILRFELGREVQQRLDIPLLLIGGAARTDMPSEAEIIAAGARAGTGCLQLDSEPVNSWQTSRRVAQLLENHEHPRVTLVTSSYHMLRMAASLRSVGVSVSGVCTDLRGHQRAIRWSDMIPSMYGLNLVRTAIHEYAMTMWYLLQGRISLTGLTATCCCRSPRRKPRRVRM